MSTRWYRLYQAGDPQRRVFLPNFWLKLIKPKVSQPKNVVVFHCSMEMTSYDIRNYLEKIYNVFPVTVKTTISQGKTKVCKWQKCVIKEDDVKVAFISLKKDEQFTFPDLIPSTKNESETEMYNELVKEYKDYVQENKMPSMPGWFRI